MQGPIRPSYKFTGQFRLVTPALSAFSIFATEVLGLSATDRGSLEIGSAEISLSDGPPASGMIPLFSTDDYALAREQFERLAYPTFPIADVGFGVLCPGGVVIAIKKD